MTNKYYTSILINYSADEADGPAYESDGQYIYVNGERKGIDTLPNEIQAKFNAHRMWTLADNFCWVARDLNGNKLNKAYIGLLEEGGHSSDGKVKFLKEINFNKDRSRDDDKNIKKFYESAKEELKVWPNCTWYVLLILDFDENSKLFDDSDFMAITHFADTDIEAAVFNEDINSFVVQGYDRGEYDTGFYSNDGAEQYLADKNNFLVSLQDRKYVDSLLKDKA
jgi:hypothetical protein